MVEEMRPALILSGPAGVTHRDLMTVIPQTTALRGSRLKSTSPCRFAGRMLSRHKVQTPCRGHGRRSGKINGGGPLLTAHTSGGNVRLEKK